MIAFAITADKDTASPLLKSVAAHLTNSDVAVAGGESLANLLRDHLANLEATRPNKMGWPRQGFWADAYKSVQNPSRVAGGVVVSATKIGLAQRFFGGDIHPIGHPFLSIPARQEAYGKNPEDFDNLKFVPLGSDRGMLVEADATRVRRSGKGYRATGEVGALAMFWLVPEVHQDRDPSVLPTQEEMEFAVGQGVVAYLLNHPNT